MQSSPNSGRLGSSITSKCRFRRATERKTSRRSAYSFGIATSGWLFRQEWVATARNSGDYRTARSTRPPARRSSLRRALHRWRSQETNMRRGGNRSIPDDPRRNTAAATAPARIAAKTSECLNLRCPQKSPYRIPNRNPITSRSGRMEHNRPATQTLLVIRGR
jgi:hypothetical protein